MHAENKLAFGCRVSKKILYTKTFMFYAFCEAKFLLYFQIQPKLNPPPLMGLVFQTLTNLKQKKCLLTVRWLKLQSFSSEPSWQSCLHMITPKACTMSKSKLVLPDTFPNLSSALTCRHTCWWVGCTSPSPCSSRWSRGSGSCSGSCTCSWLYFTLGTPLHPAHSSLRKLC